MLRFPLICLLYSYVRKIEYILDILAYDQIESKLSLENRNHSQNYIMASTLAHPRVPQPLPLKPLCCVWLGRWNAMEWNEQKLLETNRDRRRVLKKYQGSAKLL